MRIVDEYGTISYYNDEGLHHREDGPAFECLNGTKGWYINGKLHRLNGPAIEYSNGYKSWYIDGKRHREDGPAIEYSNGYKYWWINGEHINCKTQEEFERLLKMRAFW